MTKGKDVSRLPRIDIGKIVKEFDSDKTTLGWPKTPIFILENEFDSDQMPTSEKLEALKKGIEQKDNFDESINWVEEFRTEHFIVNDSWDIFLLPEQQKNIKEGQEVEFDFNKIKWNEKVSQNTSLWEILPENVSEIEIWWKKYSRKGYWEFLNEKWKPVLLLDTDWLVIKIDKLYTKEEIKALDEEVEQRQKKYEEVVQKSFSDKKPKEVQNLISENSEIMQEVAKQWAEPNILVLLLKIILGQSILGLGQPEEEQEASKLYRSLERKGTYKVAKWWEKLSVSWIDLKKYNSNPAVKRLLEKWIGEDWVTERDRGADKYVPKWNNSQNRYRCADFVNWLLQNSWLGNVATGSWVAQSFIWLNDTWSHVWIKVTSNWRVWILWWNQSNEVSLKPYNWPILWYREIYPDWTFKVIRKSGLTYDKVPDGAIIVIDSRGDKRTR